MGIRPSNQGRFMSDFPQASPLLAYHQRTRHHFEAYAEGPGQLDWDAQPDPFRHYAGAPRLSLPLTGDRYERPFTTLDQPPPSPVLPDLHSLGALLELSFGISAWKSWGGNRWALRCNPSSGNLHPLEAYLLCAGLPGVADGVHHYEPREHVLETRARVQGPPARPWLAIGLSSVMWREAWKYGERAFRYCQLDVGHGIGALGYAAALLGWRLAPLACPGGTLASLLGLDREADFPPERLAYTEAEEPEILLALQGPGLEAPPGDCPAWLEGALWQGRPSRVDPAPGYRWPVITAAAAASRAPDHGISGGAGEALPPRLPDSGPDFSPSSDPESEVAAVLSGPGAGAPVAIPGPGSGAVPRISGPGPGAAALIRQRRSAQRFDPRQSLAAPDFYRILDALLPRARAPFLGQEAAPAVHLLLFVQRVRGLPPGFYLLPREPRSGAELLAELATGDGRFAGHRPVPELDPDCPAHLGLELLAGLELQELQRLARALSCHQDIASTSAFSLAMLADFSRLGPEGHAYRRLLREAGLIGQALYLEAEAAGVRGTGIGCFFDEPVRQTLGLQDARWQSIYHFTVGAPVPDTRIETLPAYPSRSQENP